MDFLKDFILENWKVLLAILLSLANVIICLFRKKVKIVDSIRESILDRLPLFISSAENLLSSGSDKKIFVMEQVKEFLRVHFGVAFEPYSDFTELAIEKILCTPEKKGVSNK